MMKRLIFILPIFILSCSQNGEDRIKQQVVKEAFLKIVTATSENNNEVHFDSIFVAKNPRPFGEFGIKLIAKDISVPENQLETTSFPKFTKSLFESDFTSNLFVFEITDDFKPPKENFGEKCIVMFSEIRKSENYLFIKAARMFTGKNILAELYKFKIVEDSVVFEKRYYSRNPY